MSDAPSKPVAFLNLIRLLTEERERGIIVWLLNIGAEKYWNPLQPGIVDVNEDRIVGRIEEMNLLLCRAQDVLILREYPDRAYLNRLEQWGFSLPHILVPQGSDDRTPISELVLQDDNLLDELKQLALTEHEVCFVPYATTHLEEQITRRTGLKLMASPAEINAAVNDKIRNREIGELLGLPVCQGKVCSSADEIRQTYIELTSRPAYFEKVIIKEPHGASGKGLYIVDGIDKLNSLLLRLNRYARTHPEARWLVEGWYRKKDDVNYQIYVSPEGIVEVFSLKRQMLRDTVYIGSRFPVLWEGDEAARYRQYGERIGEFLHAIGYTGVAGIDSIITEEGMILPIIEINGRFTLSTYISFIGRVIGNSAKIITRYFKLTTDEPCDYTAVCTRLEAEGLLYHPDASEGVMVYTSGTLPLKRDEQAGVCYGRLFTLIVAPDWSIADNYN
ncbi:MAG: ATP-grasp domain-containing protein, partial [Gorillibacterium sp.]|nr:ATP-grasp domain-containing protein [Gorillibacterium sp.]